MKVICLTFPCEKANNKHICLFVHLFVLIAYLCMGNSMQSTCIFIYCPKNRKIQTSYIHFLSEQLYMQTDLPVYKSKKHLEGNQTQVCLCEPWFHLSSTL